MFFFPLCAIYWHLAEEGKLGYVRFCDYGMIDAR